MTLRPIKKQRMSVSGLEARASFCDYPMTYLCQSFCTAEIDSEDTIEHVFRECAAQEQVRDEADRDWETVSR